jgi:hypothetical protein
LRDPFTRLTVTALPDTGSLRYLHLHHRQLARLDAGVWAVGQRLQILRTDTQNYINIYYCTNDQSTSTTWVRFLFQVIHYAVRILTNTRWFLISIWIYYQYCSFISHAEDLPRTQAATEVSTRKRNIVLRLRYPFI